jgi:hypothetical protein
VICFNFIHVKGLEVQFSYTLVGNLGSRFFFFSFVPSSSHTILRWGNYPLGHNLECQNFAFFSASKMELIIIIVNCGCRLEMRLQIQ